MFNDPCFKKKSAMPTVAATPHIRESREQALNVLRTTSMLYLRVKVLPGASVTEVKQIMVDDTWKISVAAPATKNKANKELSGYLAGLFGVNKSAVTIISGQTDRLKLVKITV